MDQIITQFLEHIQADKGFSPNTLSAYRNDLQQLCSFLQARANGVAASDAISWGAVHQGQILDYVAALHDRSYAQATVARKIASVKSFFHFLVSQQVISANPTEGLTSPGVRRALPKTIAAWEVEELLGQPLKRETPEAGRDWAMLSLLCATGMRVTELMKLNLEDVILDQSYPYVRCVGRGARPRLIPLPGETIGPLQEYMSNAREHLLRRRDEPALFLNRRGERLTRQGFWLILKNYAKAANLPGEVTPHMLRHTFATTMLRSGRLNLRELQEFLGHASITTTQVYTHLPEGSDRPGVLNSSKANSR